MILKPVKNNKEYHITLHPSAINYDDKIGLYPVMYPDIVYPVTFEGIEFFVHTLYQSSKWQPGCWQATEKTTGLSLNVDSYETRQKAMKAAFNNIKDQGIDDTIAQIKKFDYHDRTGEW